MMGRDFKRKNLENCRNIFLYSEKGASAVEFAIVFPLLILLLFALIEFGLYLFNRHIINNACREGARAGVEYRVHIETNGGVQPDFLLNDEIEAVVRGYCDEHLVNFDEGADLDFSNLKNPVAKAEDISDPNTQRCVETGCELEVPVDYNYQFLFLKTIGIDSMLIRSNATMRME